MRSAIVTGASGFIGRNFVKYLSEKGVSVYAVGRSENMTCLRSIPGITQVQCELADIQRLPERLKDVEAPDVFYHFAWAGSTGQGRADYSLQLANAKYVCDAALASAGLGCKRFIAPGTITELTVERTVETRHASQNLPYAIAKEAARRLLEALCRGSGIDYIWVRLSNIFGADNANGNLISYTLKEISQGHVPAYGPCTQPYNFTYIDDAVSALYLLGEHNGPHDDVYTLSNGECKILKEYLTEIAEAFGGRIEIGARVDDGVEYKRDWFEDRRLQRDFGFQPEYLFSKAVETMKSKVGGEK